ncbi:hypothetical protein L1049_006310 [Liquidambar formosana]|uniref:Histone-lysine N-methyltransferase, H3 lysine-9 specific SUVH4 n=1 Tax=Liquidambar formosana TaxID=63359 RepID=A0AAP0WR94_LIQFO
MDVNNIVSGDCKPQSNGHGQLSPVSGQYMSNKEMKSKAAVSVTKNFAHRVQKIVSEESIVQRRVSPRLQKIPESQRPYYGCSPKKSVDIPIDEGSQKKAKFDHSRQESLFSVNRKDAGEKDCEIDPVALCSNTEVDSIGIVSIELRNVGLEFDEKKGAVTGSSPTNASCKSAHARVKETLRVFNTHYLHFVQEEDKRCKKLEVNDLKVVKGSEPKKGDACEEDVKRSSKRPDLKAVSKMLETNAVLYKKQIGHLPGIDVGHQFFSRAEMVVVGLHCHWLNGIDYMGKSYSKLEEYNSYTFPLAVAIVLSGQYEDDLDNSEDVVYTGQGGNDLLGNKRQVKDQVLGRGNLALKNSMEQSIPVRVIRGHESANSYCGKVYTYDGLYKVVQYWAEKGVSGFTVFKYRLRRLQGQPTLTTDQVHFSRGRASRVASELPGLVCEDICQGQEDICIPATNLFDDPPVAPPGITYTKSIRVAKTVNLPSDAPGCNCKGKCTNPYSCSCAKLNGSDFPYVCRDGGRLVEAQDVVFECGPNCGCGPSCVNRTSQRGLKYRLEVFRTPHKGWAVRSWDSIPSGAPVCEYTGVLKRTDELDNVSENDYIFEIDCWQTINGIGGRERRLRDVSVPTSNHLEKIDDKVSESAPEFCIDAGSIGNVARFINHSCDPNLFVQCVLSSHHDIRLARVVLFAADNIPPLQELTYDYGYALDSVIGPDGKIKKLPCYCGATCCRKRLY